MTWFILSHIVPHLIFGIIFIIITAITVPSEEWDLLSDMALDFSILGLGITGAVFDNPRVGHYFGENSATLAISIVSACLLLGVIIVGAKARVVRMARHFSFWRGIMVLILGILALAMPTVALIWSYMYGRA